MSDTKSRWQHELDALPSWAQKMVCALKGCRSYGFGKPDSIFDSDFYTEARIMIRNEHLDEWLSGFHEMRELAAALTAPFPQAPEQHQNITTTNLVEIIASGDEDRDCAFDQPCHFGHRVDTHAVYCHNKAWPDSPRKCRRNQDDYRHEDCPGFVPNNSLIESK